jgi:hypothetical protein
MHVHSPSARTHAAAALVHGPRLQSTTARQAELLETKHFLCACSRCTEPPESDAWLNGYCCSVCGPKGVITDAAQQLQQEADILGELLQDTVTTASSSTSGSSSKRKGKQSAKQSAAVAAVQSGSNGSTAGAGAGGGQQLLCSSCKQFYTAAQLQAALKKALTARTQWSVTRQHCSPADALKQLQQWFEEHDAGSMPTGTTGTGSATTAKKQGNGGSKSSATAAVKLHPCSTTVLEALVQMANARNAAQQYAGAAKAFKRVVTAMEAVLPEHFPEIAGLCESWCTALHMVLTARTAALPKRLREGYVADARYAAQKCYAVRLVSLGEDHASTAIAAAALAQSATL